MNTSCLMPAARQLAIYRGLGYRGVYLGGVHNFAAVERILVIAKTFARDDWKQFAREILFSRPGECFFYNANEATGLADSTRSALTNLQTSARASVPYLLSKWTHDLVFTRDSLVGKVAARLYQNARDPKQGPPLLRAVEHLSKGMLYQCRDCGDCSLPDIAFLCPESQCAKNQRNGPCGGTREGRCEVEGYGECIWMRAYERLKSDQAEGHLLDHAPVVQNQGLRGTSAWANFWLRRDHAAKRDEKARHHESATSEKLPNTKPANAHSIVPGSQPDSQPPLKAMAATTAPHFEAETSPK